MSNPFPTTRSELACMTLCYLLVAALFYMAIFPERVFALLIGGFA
jgi:hypothetical protein